jgi:hypothetical protein
MRREAVEGDRPRPVAALAEAASVPWHVPVTSVEQVALNGVVQSGARDPVDVAGVVAGAFYAHFASKEDLVANVLADQLRAQRRTLNRTPAHRRGRARGRSPVSTLSPSGYEY